MPAQIPEELDPLVEDAFVMRDRAVAGELFADGALLVARGGQAIGRILDELWARDFTYVARSPRVLRSRDVALVVADGGIHVLRRDGGVWRSAISLLNLGSEDA